MHGYNAIIDYYNDKMAQLHALILSCNFGGTSRLAGGYRIATFLRSHSWDVEVIDFVMHWTIDELKEIITSRISLDTKFVGFATMWSMWNQHVETILKWIKNTYPDMITIIGGQQCQMIDSSADYFINGYGENAILALARHHFSNSTQGLKFDQWWLTQNKKVLRHDDYPSAPMKSLLVSYEPRDFVAEQEWLPMEFSRGCKFECKFCNYPILGVKSDYSRDADDFDRHVRELYDQFGVTNYYVCDETFNDSVEKMQKFANVVKRLDFSPYFSGFVRGDLMVIRPQDRELLAQIGFFGQYYGIETMNHLSGKLIGKGMHPDKLMPGILELRSYFKSIGPYRGDISLIVGLPEETEETAMAAVQWLYDNWQGEAVYVWPLGLPQDQRLNKLNALSRDRDKYGYRPSNVPIKRDISNVLMSNLFNWENDHFTFARATEFCSQVYDEIRNRDFRISCWDLGEHGKTDINEILQLPSTQKRFFPADMIRRYKDGKMKTNR